jgi:hypothetical protein
MHGTQDPRGKPAVTDHSGSSAESSVNVDELASVADSPSSGTSTFTAAWTE